MNQTKEGWEERFDKEFHRGGPVHHFELCHCGEGEEYNCEKEIKDFIRSLLQETEERVAKIIEKQIGKNIRTMIEDNGRDSEISCNDLLNFADRLGDGETKFHYNLDK